MKTIIIPADVMQRIIDCNIGRRTVQPCKVNWPELQLTEEQVLANAIAHSKGHGDMYPDPSYIELVFER